MPHTECVCSTAPTPGCPAATTCSSVSADDLADRATCGLPSRRRAQNRLPRQPSFVLAAGGNQQFQRVRFEHHAVIAAGADRPIAIVKQFANLLQRLDLRPTGAIGRRVRCTMGKPLNQSTRACAVRHDRVSLLKDGWSVA